MDFDFEVQVHSTEFDLNLEHEFRRPPPGLARTPGEFIPLKSKTSPIPVVSVFECPRCTELNAVDAIECRRCGVVFDRLLPGDVESQAEWIALAKDPALLRQWQELFTDYLDLEAHRAFLAACENVGSLAFASRKYAEILHVSPHEEIAFAMQRKITALVSRHAFLRPRTEPWIVRLPMLNSLVIMLGSCAFVMGMLLPKARSMAWIGAVCLVISLSLRYLAESRRSD